jgi:hypothetical protein
VAVGNAFRLAAVAVGRLRSILKRKFILLCDFTYPIIIQLCLLIIPQAILLCSLEFLFVLLLLVI